MHLILFFLLFQALVDQQEVFDMIGQELALSLQECLDLPAMQYCHYGGGLEGTSCTIVKDEFTEGISLFCRSVVSGLQSLVQTVTQTADVDIDSSPSPEAQKKTTEPDEGSFVDQDSFHSCD